MNTSALSFLAWPTTEQPQPQRRELRLFGFNRDRNALLVLNEQGERRALRLTLPGIFNLHFRQDPYPANSTPVSLLRTALHLPPCRETREQAEAIHDPDLDAGTRVAGPVIQDWERAAASAVYLEGTEAEERELERRRRAHLAACHAEYEAAHAELEGRAHSLSQAQLVEERRALDGQFKIIRDGTHGSFRIASVFDLTLDDVKQGNCGIRDDYLCEHWAALFNFELSAVARDARLFQAWLERAACNATTHTINTGERGVTLRLFDAEWAVLEALVRYELRFTDGARVWLAGIEEAAVLTPQEVEDFDKHEGKPAAEVRSFTEQHERHHHENLEQHALTRALTTQAGSEIFQQGGVTQEMVMGQAHESARRVLERTSEPVSDEQARGELRSKEKPLGKRRFNDLLKQNKLSSPITRIQLDDLKGKRAEKRRKKIAATSKRNAESKPRSKWQE